MILFYGSMATTVFAIIVYQLVQKSIPKNADITASLIVTYSLALLVSLLIYPIVSKGGGGGAAFRSLNWASFALGLVIVLTEVGFLMVYRTGWQVSRAYIFASVMAMILLIPISLFFFKESLSWQNLLGIFLALSGILLMVR